MKRIETIAELESHYAKPGPASLVKVTDHLSPSYRQLIAASPFCVLSTVGPEGLDGSPRGDQPGFVRVVNDRTLVLPDRMGNNRIDSLRNVVRDPRAALLFLIPGSGQTLRVNGRAFLTADTDVRQSFSVDGKLPRTVMVIDIVEVFFQCARAIMRANLWDVSRQVDPASLPTAGQMLAEISGGEVAGEAYDAAWPERAKDSMW